MGRVHTEGVRRLGNVEVAGIAASSAGAVHSRLIFRRSQRAAEPRAAKGEVTGG